MLTGLGSGWQCEEDVFNPRIRPGLVLYALPDVVQRRNSEERYFQVPPGVEAADLLGQLAVHITIRAAHHLGEGHRLVGIGRAHGREDRGYRRRGEEGRLLLLLRGRREGDVNKVVGDSLLEDVGQHGRVGTAHAQRNWAVNQYKNVYHLKKEKKKSMEIFSFRSKFNLDCSSFKKCVTIHILYSL